MVPVMPLGYAEHALDRAHRAADAGADCASNHPADGPGDPVALTGALLGAATMPWAWPAWGIARNAERDGRSREEGPTASAAASRAAVLTLGFPVI